MAGNLKILLQGRRDIAHPYSITVFGDYLYWTDWLEKSVKKWKKDGSEDITDKRSIIENVRDLHVYDASRQIGN